MRKIMTEILLGTCLLVLGQGCTTVRESLTRRLTITSSPTWADFRIVGDPTIYNTPTQLQLPPDHPYTVRLEKEGYEPVLLRIKILATLKPMEKQSGAQPSNWDVEALSEAQYRVVGDMIIVTLKPIPQPEPVFVPPPVQQSVLMEDVKPRKTLEERLKELDRMKKKGKISAKKYKALKKKAVEEYK